MIEKIRNIEGSNVILHYLQEQGVHAKINEAAKGPDILVYSGFKPKFYIVHEVRKNWKVGKFPFRSITLYPSAVELALSSKLTGEIWYLRSDLERAIVIPEPLYETGKYLIIGDKVHDVPINECKEIVLR